MNKKTPFQVRTLCLLALSAGISLTPDLCAAGSDIPTPADTVFRNAYVYTVDQHDKVAQALAVKDGKIVYVGSNTGVARLIGDKTRVADLGGRMLMPGLVDGHMHPLGGGAQLLTCNLDYQPLTTAQFQARIQHCLDAEPKSDDTWLQVSNWYRQFMRPPGTDASRATLDALKTKRPILVISSDYHSLLVNSRALEIAGIGATTPDPAGGTIAHDTKHEPTGILEDDARALILAKLPPPQAEEQLAGAAAALDAMRRQGITSFLDAAAGPDTMSAFTALQHAGKLTARAHFAPVIDAEAAAEPDKAIAALQKQAHDFDQGPLVPAPGITVRNVKIFMDGVLQAPAQTAGMLQPYFVNAGTATAPKWQPGTQSGPVYVTPEVLNPLIEAIAKAGFDPHVHAIGDRAVRQTLDAYALMRKALPGQDIRAAIAHDETVDPADDRRFRALDVIPVMSYQWAKRGPDSIDGARDFLGPTRFRRMEPEGSLYAAGARIAFGSDWPVDRLDEWFALKVGVTRTGDGTLGPQYDGPFNAEKGLTRAAVLRSITMNSAYELHQDAETGSLEPGKLADLIVLDRNPLHGPAEGIAKVKVVLTMVGGKVVWSAPKKGPSDSVICFDAGAAHCRK
jgi:predicted amidohydrolase YtcJ